MKAKRIIYSRLVSKGNYENAKIEIELEVEQGEKANDVLKAAKEFVESKIKLEKTTPYEIQQAKNIIKNPDDYTLGRIKEAEKLIRDFDEELELPF